jgi:hypothetical protein
MTLKARGALAAAVGLAPTPLACPRRAIVTRRPGIRTATIASVPADCVHASGLKQQPRGMLGATAGLDEDRAFRPELGGVSLLL